MEHIIAPLVLEYRRARLETPEIRFRREWETRRDADRYAHLWKQARSRLGEVTPNPAA